MKKKLLLFICYIICIQKVWAQKEKMPAIDTSKTAQLKEIQISSSKNRSLSKSTLYTEIYNKKYFEKNASLCLTDAISMINGAQTQDNCNVCNSTDIKINGLEGAYTLITIDGMPIVSALGSLYSLSSIPVSMIENIEIHKGPAATWYGSEAMGGVINIVTKNANAPEKVNLQWNTTQWAEMQLDATLQMQHKNTKQLIGISLQNNSLAKDENQDNFTDISLKKRISLFHKLNFNLKNKHQLDVIYRVLHEDRWGGEMQWNKNYRLSDQIYGEHILTNRFELLSKFQIPGRYPIEMQFSHNSHFQDAAYGTNAFKAKQHITFFQGIMQANWIKNHENHLGITLKNNFYDDETPATQKIDGTNKVFNQFLTGLFLQDDWKINQKWSLLLGARMDYYTKHALVFSKKLALQYQLNEKNQFKLSYGNGFRMVQLFTEDHAAISGSREVIIEEALLPEKSEHLFANYASQIVNKQNINIKINISAFYNYFSNKIIGDFDSNPNEIRYRNLQGYALAKGISAEISASFKFPLTLEIGTTLLDAYEHRNNVKIPLLYQNKWTGNYLISYTINPKWTLNITGNVFGKMRLPIQDNDYRAAYSPIYQLTHIQSSHQWKAFTLSLGIKNLLNFKAQNPLMRPFDPFDKYSNDPISNPNGYTFDTAYHYGPIRGRYFYLQLNFALMK